MADWTNLPNYPAVYETKGIELYDVALDPRYAELLAYQSQEMSALTARHAQERIKLALAIKDQWVDEDDES